MSPSQKVKEAEANTQAVPQGPGIPGSRKFTTRSRTGCLVCRKRRVRCDEQPGSCQNCIRTGRTCEYPEPKKTAGESGKTQKQDEIVKISQSSNKSIRRRALDTYQIITTTGPFDGFQVDLPLRSKDLFRYFYQSAWTKDSVLMVKVMSCLRPETLKSSDISNSMLLAGTQFTWMTGGLQSFESTFIFHKLLTIRMVNRWILTGDSHAAMSTVGQIATLCLSEICLGEMEFAEAHLRGMVTILNQQLDLRDENGQEDGPEEELANRYFILTHTFLNGCKSSLEDATKAAADEQQRREDTPPADKLDVFTEEWLGQQRQDELQESSLFSIQLLPMYFYPLPQGVVPGLVNGRDTVTCLRDVTKDYNNSFWGNGMASAVLERWTLAHVSSVIPGYDAFQNETSPKYDFVTSWCSLCISSGIYVSYVLKLWGPLESTVHRYTIRLLNRCITYEVAEWENSSRTRKDFLFWQHFLGAICVHARPADTENPENFLIYRRVRDLSHRLGLRDWKHARTVLTRTAWPMSTTDESATRELWESIVLDG